MLNSNLRKYLLACALPIIILLIMPAKPFATYMFGEEITLHTRPVDPTDLFRGDYVTLAYDIDSIPLDRFPEEFKGLNVDYSKYKYFNENVNYYYGNEYYEYNTGIRRNLNPEEVKEKDKEWERLQKERDAIEKRFKELSGKTYYSILKKEGSVYIIDHVSDKKSDNAPYIRFKLNRSDSWRFSSSYNNEKLVPVSYNMDRYFVQENTGSKLEEAARKGQLDARVKVLNGYPVVVGLVEREEAK